MLSPTDAPPLPARVTPPDGRLSTLGVVRRLLRNSIELWPPETYERPLLRQRRFGRDILVVMDPDLIQQILVDQADAFVKAETMRRALSPALGEGILTADGARWRWQRRAAAPIFRRDRIESFLPGMIAAAERTRARWLAAAGRELDIAQEMMRTTFDIIVETMLSGRGSIDVDRVERGVTDHLSSTGWMILLALLRAPDWMPYPGRRRTERARGYLRGELLRLAAERRQGGEPRNDLLTLLLETSDPETGQAMTDRELADNLLTFIAAGHETTALALTWTFYLLSLDPAVEASVLDEIAAVTGGMPLKPAHVEALGYTRQVVHEAMRLYPPAGIVVRQAARDVLIGGEEIARGTPVNVPIYAVHRHRALWHDPDTFDPERFAPDAAKARHRYAYLPFGAGPRICIGMTFALAEAVAILATLLPAIRLTLRAGYTPEPRLRVTLRPAAGMPMRVDRRPRLNDSPPTAPG
jgi:cytochrome P450